MSKYEKKLWYSPATARKISMFYLPLNSSIFRHSSWFLTCILQHTPASVLTWSPSRWEIVEQSTYNKNTYTYKANGLMPRNCTEIIRLTLWSILFSNILHQTNKYEQIKTSTWPETTNEMKLSKAGRSYRLHLKQSEKHENTHDLNLISGFYTTIIYTNKSKPKFKYLIETFCWQSSSVQTYVKGS